MAATVLPGFAHLPGVHCGSTALADVVRHLGLGWSEPLCFGLGSGLAFYCLHSEVPPTRMLLGRTATLEADFCQAVGLHFQEQTEPDLGLAWERVRQRVDEGQPVILSTDVRYLPYYRTSSPFNGHRVVLAGYDREAQLAFLADTEREGLQEVPLPDLTRARTSDGPPAGFNHSLWLEITKPGPVRPLAETVPGALRLVARHALADVTGFGGCEALDRFAQELPGWARLSDARYSARFAYQVIERRGTGGGLFRRLYARFLSEVEAACPGLPLAGLAPQMEAIAATWTQLSLELKSASEGQRRWAEAAALAEQVARAERDFFTQVAGRFGP